MNCVCEMQLMWRAVHDVNALASCDVNDVNHENNMNDLKRVTDVSDLGDHVGFLGNENDVASCDVNDVEKIDFKNVHDVNDVNS